MSTREPDDDEEGDRTTTNIILVVGFVLLVGGGIWLANAMLDARQADECMSSGRRNCNPIEVPARGRFPGAAPARDPSECANWAPGRSCTRRAAFARKSRRIGRRPRARGPSRARRRAARAAPAGAQAPLRPATRGC